MCVCLPICVCLYRAYFKIDLCLITNAYMTQGTRYRLKEEEWGRSEGERERVLIKPINRCRGFWGLKTACGTSKTHISSHYHTRTFVANTLTHVHWQHLYSLVYMCVCDNLMFNTQTNTNQYDMCILVVGVSLCCVSCCVFVSFIPTFLTLYLPVSPLITILFTCQIQFICGNSI